MGRDEKSPDIACRVMCLRELRSSTLLARLSVGFDPRWVTKLCKRENRAEADTWSVYQSPWSQSSEKNNTDRQF